MPATETRRALSLASLVALVSLLMAIVLTWPLARHLGDSLPLGTERVATVPLLNLWTLWWNRHNVSGSGDPYWDAPIFYPARDAFACSEPQPLAGLAAALLAGLTGSDVSAYNLLVLGALALNGLSVAILLRALGLGPPAVMAGAVMAVGLPFVHQQLGVLQLIPLVGPVGTLVALRKLELAPGTFPAVALGAAFAATYLLCTTYALLFAIVLIPTAAWILAPSLSRPRSWLALGGAAALALALVAPVVRAQLRASRAQGWSRPADTVRALSARPADFLRVPWAGGLLLPGVTAAGNPADPAYWPGVGRLTLALAGIVLGGRLVPRRSIAALVTLGVAGFTLALGPNDEVAGVSLHRVLVAHVPGFAAMRTFSRAAVFPQLAVVVLAAIGWACLGRVLAGRRWGAVLLPLVAAVAALSPLPRSPELAPLPALDSRLAWLSFLEHEARPGSVLAFLPIPQGSSVDEYLPTAQWMYWQMRHGQPMVNGYSGFFPPEYERLRLAAAGFPDPESVGLLFRYGVRYCVLPRAIWSRATLELSARRRLAHVRLALRWVAGDDAAGLEVYEIEERGTGRREAVRTGG